VPVYFPHAQISSAVRPGDIRRRLAGVALSLWPFLLWQRTGRLLLPDARMLLSVVSVPVIGYWLLVIIRHGEQASNGSRLSRLWYS